MARHRRTTLIGLAVATTMLVVPTGCEDQSSPDTDRQSPAGGASPSEAASEAGATGSQEERIAAALAQKAEDLGIADPPEVAIERIVSSSEWPEVYAACMTEAGFPTTLTGDGQGTQTDVPPGQGEAANIADYTCWARFPVDPDEDPSNLSDDQKKVVYQYLAVTLVDCLESHGYQISGVPALETFLAGYGASPPWNPLLQIFETNISATDGQALQAACPPNTPPELIYGD